MCPYGAIDDYHDEDTIIYHRKYTIRFNGQLKLPLYVEAKIMAGSASHVHHTTANNRAYMQSFRIILRLTYGVASAPNQPMIHGGGITRRNIVFPSWIPVVAAFVV